LTASLVVVADLAAPPPDYGAFLAEMVARVRLARAHALRSVNEQLVLLYWEVGREILQRQEREGWGAKVIDRLAGDLRVAFPDMGWSPRSLKYMRAFARAWPQPEIVQGRLAQLPWSHQIAVVGRQRHLEVGGQDFFIDLLLYQLVLRCYVVVELKVGEFEPEYAGKVNFYLAAVDELIKRPDDRPTIGLILCKGANETVVEYALRDLQTPIQVSEYRTTPLPEPLCTELPAVAEIEAALSALPMPLVQAGDAGEAPLRHPPAPADL
jgi:predicted nuclease of restriction endonuclease-like (RecB) superfamily